MNAPHFATDLARGQAGEAFLTNRHPGLTFPSGDERRWDLEAYEVDSFDGQPYSRIEVKTDSRPRRSTPNFFMEQRTRVRGQDGYLLGGPWRAVADGVDTFVYLYHDPEHPADSVAYWFDDIPALTEHLDEHIDWYEVRRVRSARLTAVGVLVPRVSLKHLARRVVYG